MFDIHFINIYSALSGSTSHSLSTFFYLTTGGRPSS